ncbi:hypothetical protein K432DRAFT_423268 [Lepidopterella palustris CBS 459.81]|uniref:Uncharacterized protein n=1 Tax=Lepidopterella palustris CBS 459.81 TaxID=1314670 RepID=A0A8E2EGU0_9PEZI|nr:hypothetical protein K432DRAFT_423268 [Lepidopterella palustris CBS 459.81]
MDNSSSEEYENSPDNRCYFRVIDDNSVSEDELFSVNQSVAYEGIMTKLDCIVECDEDVDKDTDENATGCTINSASTPIFEFSGTISPQKEDNHQPFVVVDSSSTPVAAGLMAHKAIALGASPVTHEYSITPTESDNHVQRPTVEHNISNDESSLAPDVHAPGRFSKPSPAQRKGASENKRAHATCQITSEEVNDQSNLHISERKVERYEGELSSEDVTERPPDPPAQKNTCHPHKEITSKGNQNLEPKVEPEHAAESNSVTPEANYETGDAIRISQQYHSQRTERVALNEPSTRQDIFPKSGQD